jgi:hypothetical protein
VEYAAGLAFHPDGQRLVASLGIRDGEAWLATMLTAAVRAALREREPPPTRR